MAGYLGAVTVGMDVTSVDVEGDITSTDTSPEVTLQNTTEEDTDGGRESKITFKGEQSGGEVSTLAQIQASHDGTADDEKGDLIFSTNDGSDGNTPTERMRMDSAGNVTFTEGTDIITDSAGTDNVRIGAGAGDSIASGGNNNVAIGKDALTANTTASNNTAVGYQAGQSNTTGALTAFGSQALKANTTGNYNHAFGESALLSNTTGQSNIAMGGSSLRSNTTGSSNVAMGDSALRSSTTSSSGVAVGHQALTAVTTGSNNVAIGAEAGKAVTTGYANNFIGRNTGVAVTTGNTNTFMGHNSGDAMTTGSKNTIIGGYSGNQNNLDIRTTNDQIVLSNGDGKPYGYFDPSGGLHVGVSGSGGSEFSSYYTDDGLLQAWDTTGEYMLHLHCGRAGVQYFCEFEKGGSTIGHIRGNNTSVTYATSSDHRVKENVVDLTGATARLKQLDPKRFNFIAEPNQTVDGFLAHEVQTVVPEAVTGTHNQVKTWTQEEIDAGDAPDNTSAGDNKLDGDGNTIPVYQGIDQSKLVPLLTAALQEAITKIETLETEMTSVKARLDALESA